MQVIIQTEGANQWGILRRLSEEIASRLPYVSINSPEPADLTLFINYALYRPVKGIRAALFTHREEGKLGEVFDSVAKDSDVQISMCQITDQFVERAGGKNRHVILTGGSFSKRITFGVCGQVKDSGRKGEHLVGQMVDEGFNVVAHGHGWPCRIIEGKIDRLPQFYEQIDYLVITSLNEGGPQPLVDAISLGVPVIAPNVGMCWEFPVIRYDKGNWDSLKSVLTALGRPRTWDDWAADHDRLFKACLASSS